MFKIACIWAMMDPGSGISRRHRLGVVVPDKTCERDGVPDVLQLRDHLSKHENPRQDDERAPHGTQDLRAVEDVGP